jgi:hypothetical protein
VTTLYRILRTNTPTAPDFRSHLARCDPRRGAELADPLIWAGISAFSDAARAAQRARRFSLGTHLAQLHIDEADPRMVFRPTLATGHFTVWACENLLLSSIRAIEPIETMQSG